MSRVPLKAAGRQLQSLPGLLFPAALLAALFCAPEAAFSGFSGGLRLALTQVLPAVFPLMTACIMLAESPAARWLGCGLRPCCLLLGIREPAAATALFLGLLGGFPGLVQGLRSLAVQGKISRQQTELLLCTGLNAGPGFFVFTVGRSMLGSAQLGALLWGCTLLGGFCAAVLVRFFLPRVLQRSTGGEAPSPGSTPNPVTFPAAVERAVRACGVLAGFIVFFSVIRSLLTVLLPGGPVWAALLEVTSGVHTAAQLHSPLRLPLVLSALVWSGLCVHLQAKALLPQGVGLGLFYASRPPALLFALLWFRLGLRLFPQALPAAAITPVPRFSRFSGGIWVSFFLLIAAFLYECTPKRVFTPVQK